TQAMPPPRTTLCPYTTLFRSTGYVVFTMPENEQEKWEVILTYSVEGTSHTVEIPVEVKPSDHRTVSFFEGSDNQHYILALVEPLDRKSTRLNSSHVSISYAVL